MKIKFIKDREEKLGVGVPGRFFKKDDVYEVNEASAKHWIDRGVAVQVPDSTKATKEYDAPDEAKLKANLAATTAHEAKEEHHTKPAK